MNKKFLITFFIIVEISGIIFLGFKIYKKKTNILGATSINIIRKENIIRNPPGKLKYFYEPKANSISTDTANWFPNGTVLDTINSDSLNERYEYKIDKPPDTYRIITLGNSFTFGMWIDTKSNWTEKLEDQLNQKLVCKNIKKFEVINLGVAGYDVTYTAERYKLRGKKYSPDLVIWLLINTDFQKIDEIITPLSNYYWGIFKKEGTLYGKLINGDYAKVLNSIFDKQREQFTEKEILDYQMNSLVNITRNIKSKLLLVTFPNTQLNYIEALKKFTDSHKNSTYLYSNLVDINSKAAILPDNYHPNIKGHELISRDLFSYLTNNKIIPCE